MAKSNNNSIRYIYNIFSIIGFLIAGLAAALIAVILAYEVISGHVSNYLGLFTFFVLPGVVVLGLAMVVAGALWTRHLHRRSGKTEAPAFPRIDLNDPQKRFHIIFFIVASCGLLAVVGLATMQGLHYAESPAFCGELCHPPMQPEYVAWKNSPHARVKCVECHIGEGIQHHIKAKLNGTKQLLSIITGTYPTPIHTPVHGLRPSRDTCEKCHWTEKFYGGRVKTFNHNAPNEANSSREATFLIKIGGSPKSPHATGIHWHIANEVTYVARDRQRQDIPYIAVKHPDGSIVEYTDSEKPMTQGELAKGEKRRLDCIDCHNRPTHIYHSPSKEIDDYFTSGKLDQSLPYLKKVALDLLTREYKDEADAKKAFAAGIPEYYARNYPEVAARKAESIKTAVDVCEKIFARNFFPKMKVAWDTYPDNIGHFYFPGCFRCHDGKHKTASGKVISKDCNLCHTLMSQKQENIPVGVTVKNFVHPADIGDELYKTNCSECHLPKKASEEKKQGSEKHH